MLVHWYRSLITILTLLCFLMVASVTSADAQKKQTTKKTPAKVQPKTTAKPAVKEQAKEAAAEEEEAVEEEPAEEVTPPPSSTLGSLPNKFLDVLKQYTGEKTNLGTIKKFAGDYIIFEDDQVTTLVPVTAIQSAQLVKDEDTGEYRLELKLISKD